MKYFLFLIALITASVNAQEILKFDKRNVECEDKWVAYQKDNEGAYNFGFIYFDTQAGFTLNYGGKFKIDENGKFNLVPSQKNQTNDMKIRLNPNRVAIAEIPEEKLKELAVEKIPNWLSIYKGDENSINRLYRRGFIYNAGNECETALTYLEKAEKIDPNYKGLQTELAFSYNALGKYDQAENCLKKAIVQNPKDCYTYKELAYAYTKQFKMDKAIETYNNMSSLCAEKNYIGETAYNLAYIYFTNKDRSNFTKWKLETEKWSKPEDQIAKNLVVLETEINK